MVPDPTRFTNSFPEVHLLKSSTVGIAMFALRVTALGVKKGFTKELIAIYFNDEERFSPKIPETLD